MKYYNLIFAVFHLWRLAITTLYKQSCFFIIIINNVNLLIKVFVLILYEHYLQVQFFR